MRAGIRWIIIATVFLLNITVILVTAFLLDTSEMVDPDISLRVTRTWIEEGEYDNITPVRGMMWQIMQVEMKNLNSEKDVGISVTHFYSYSTTDQRYWIYNAEDYSYDPIPPGGSEMILITFMIDSDQVLDELEYARSISSPAVCPIPDPV